MTDSEGIPSGGEERRALEQACFDEGLLTKAFGGLPRITKKGQKLVKLYAAQDEEVRDALRAALDTRWRDRRDALVTVLEFAVLRRDGRV